MFARAFAVGAGAAMGAVAGTALVGLVYTVVTSAGIERALRRTVEQWMTLRDEAEGDFTASFNRIRETKLEES